MDLPTHVPTPAPPPPTAPLARDFYASSTHGGSNPHEGLLAVEMDDGMAAIGGNQHHHARRHGGAGAADAAGLFDRDYEVHGRRVRLMPVQQDGPCGTFAGIQTVMMAILALQVILLLCMILGACIGWFYIYPNMVELMDDKIKNVGALAINLAEENSGPLLDMIECVIHQLGDSVNDALGPLLGAEINFGNSGNASLFDMCPFNFAGINHTVSSATMDEVLGSSFETSAPSFHSQLHDLKYGAESTSGGSSQHSYAPVYYLSDGSPESPSSA